MKVAEGIYIEDFSEFIFIFIIQVENYFINEKINLLVNNVTLPFK
jgi:hypothetical protein